MVCIFKVICAPVTRGRPPLESTLDVLAGLKEFFNEHYADIMFETLDYAGLSNCLQYMAMEVITMLKNGIKSQFSRVLFKFISSNFPNLSNSDVYNIYNDIMFKNSGSNVRSTEIDWINSNLSLMLAGETTKLYETVFYHLASEPLAFLPNMLYMAKQVAVSNKKVPSICPLSASFIPRNMRIDTAILISLLHSGKKTEFNGKVGEMNPEIWNKFFKTHLKEFHAYDSNDFTFDHQIVTDGVSCSILLIRKKKAVESFASFSNRSGATDRYLTDVTCPFEYHENLYLKIVAIDPNMRDLLFCVDSDGINMRDRVCKHCTTGLTDLSKCKCKEVHDQNVYRYTKSTRRKETKVAGYRRLIQTMKRRPLSRFGPTAQQCEEHLSEFNTKTLSFEEFKICVKERNFECMLYLGEFYEQYIFRKLKFSAFIGRQITEARMINNFKKKFGPPEKVIVCIGDWTQKMKKHHEPTKGKGFRETFRRAGYKVYLVDEYRTSKKCSNCEKTGDVEGICEDVKRVVNPRPWRRAENPTVNCHGLRKCNYCEKLWNRDVNAANNIWKCADAARKREPRPLHLQKRANSSTSNTLLSAPLRE
jgi:hypothetical protein